jgi:FHS family L-fucose permease-like MFS transporter
MISKRFGYKKTIIFGLSLYVIGALCFYPSATNLSFGGFIGSLFVIACGISTLENCNVFYFSSHVTACINRFSHLGANTYITIIGSRESAAFRINGAQAFNGLASTIAPVVASYAFFGSNEDTTGTKNLDTVKWTYVGVACGM